MKSMLAPSKTDIDSMLSIGTHSVLNGKSNLKRTSEGELYTELILELFKLNGVVLAAGDQLVESLNLTSARWQVLGAIREKPLPVAQIARDMGLTR